MVVNYQPRDAIIGRARTDRNVSLKFTSLQGQQKSQDTNVFVTIVIHALYVFCLNIVVWLLSPQSRICRVWIRDSRRTVRA